MHKLAPASAPMAIPMAIPSRKSNGELMTDTKKRIGDPHRIPKDKTQPLRYWEVIIELPPHGSTRRRKFIRSKDKAKVLDLADDARKLLKENGDLPSADQTVAQWFTYWLNSLASKEVRPKTLAGYRSVVNNHIIPAIGTVRLSKLTPAHVRRVEDAILKTPKDRKRPELGYLSSTYALNAHRVMSSSFTIAEREGRISRNPAKLSAAPRKAIVNLEVLTLEEAIHIVEVMAREEHSDLGARWVTSLLTGARRGEVIGLTRDRVTDVLDFSWQLQRLALTETPGKPDAPVGFEYQHLVGGLYLTRPKSRAGTRVVPLVEPLKSILERYIEQTPANAYGLVFAPDGYPVDPDQDSAAWQSVLDAAKIKKHIRLHDARHGFVDMIYAAGVSEDLIVEIVGHSTRAMSRSYKSPASLTRRTEAMKALSAPFVK